VTLPEFSLLLIAILTSATGQFLLKLGALQLGKVNAANWLTHLSSILTTPALLVGLGSYGLGAMVYILLLTRVNLSVAAPSASLMYVFSVFIGYFVFRETIPLSRAIGLGLIICGVLLVVWRR
jgi:drug/metabolite transporter (DMT)-like permease